MLSQAPNCPLSRVRVSLLTNTVPELLQISTTALQLDSLTIFRMLIKLHLQIILQMQQISTGTLETVISQQAIIQHIYIRQLVHT